MTNEDSDSFFDKMLGKDELKSRIQELETELESKNEEIQSLRNQKEKLEEEVEKVRQKKSKEVTDKQKAYEERNKLQDKIRELQDKMQKQESEEDDESTEYSEQELSPSEVKEVVSAVNSVQYNSEVAVVSSVEEDSIPDELLDLYDNREVLVDVAPCVVFADEFGVVRFGIRTPVGIPDTKRSDEFSFSDELFVPQEGSLFVLIRSDIFAIGRTKADGSLEHLKGFRSNVKSSHSKGGFSQSRFERIREEQIDNHIEDSVEKIEEYNDETVPRVVITGQKDIVNRVSEYADVTGYTDASGSPKDSLRDSYYSFWSLKTYSL